MDKEELKFNIKKNYKTFVLILLYFFKDPYYEVKKLVSGYYASSLVFWLAVVLFGIAWKKGLENSIKAMAILVFITYFYMFAKSKKWKDYYESEIQKELIKNADDKHP